MAQYKSQAREGSFSANQVNVPDDTAKLQSESNRVMKGMSTAQAHLENTRDVFQRAQEISQRLTSTSAAAANRANQENYKTQASNAKNIWDAELRADENRTKEKEQTYKLLGDFSKTAFKVATGIVQKNKENQLKAINQIALTNGLNSDTLNAISQLDREMSAAEFQRTEIVQQWLTEGKSQDFIDITYDHLLKGGGYTNYVENSFVLKNQGIKDSSAFQEVIADETLKPEEKKRRLEQIKAELVANVTVNGQVPKAEFLAEHYFPAIYAAEKEAIRAINGETRKAVEFETRNTRIQLYTNAYIGDGRKKNPQAAWELFQNNPSKEGRVELAKILTNLGSLEDNRKLADTKFPGPNGTMVSLMDYPETADIIERAIKNKETERNTQFETAQKLEFAEREFKLQQMVEKAYGDKDGLTKKELLDLQQYAVNEYGAGHTSQILAEAAKHTIDKQAIPLMEEALKDYVATGNASLRGLESFGTMPKSLEDRYKGIIADQAKLRNSTQYTDALKNFDATIKGTIKSQTYLDYVQGGYNSPDVLWYAGRQREMFIQRLQRYSGTTTNFEEAIRLAETETINSIEKELEATGAVTTLGGIKMYRDLLEDEKDKITKAQADAKELTAFAQTKQARSPKGWIQFYQGEDEIIEASEQLQKGQQSPFFEQIGQKLNPRNPMAPWEVQAWFAPAVEGMEPMEPPASFEAIKERLTSADRRSLFGNTSSTQEKIRILREQLGETQLPVRASYQQAKPLQGKWQSLAVQAGFTPAEAEIMAAIVMAESGGDAAIDTVKSGLDPDKSNEFSIGGPQINVAVHQDKLAARGFTEEDMRDPLKSMIIAKDVFDQQGFGAWTTYNKGLHEAFFNQASAGDRSFTGALTYDDNKESYKTAGNAFKDAGFRVGEHSDFDQVDPVHSSNSYHYHDEAFDITHQTGDYNASIEKTGRLQELIQSLDLFDEVIGPLSGDPDHATHLHLGGLKRPMTAEDMRLIKSLK